MFKKEINNAPLTHLGGKGGYYRKLLIVFLLIFTLIVPFSVNAYTTDVLDFYVNPNEVRPNFQLINLGDGETFEGFNFTYGTGYSFLDNSFTFRDTNGTYPSADLSGKQYWLSFIIPSLPLKEGDVYKISLPISIEGVGLKELNASSSVLCVGRQFDGLEYSTGDYAELTGTKTNVKSYSHNGNTVYTFTLNFEFVANHDILENWMFLRIKFNSGLGSWRWFGFYDKISFIHTDLSADQISNAITNQGNQIVNGMQQQAEQEKNEINSSGNSNLDGLTSAVPDYSSGFVTALTKLGSAMGYNGRNSVWSIPAIYIPEIQGVIPRTKLIDTQQIDFSNMFNKIPSNIIIFVRSLTTILLIVYCGKELYSLFSFIFNSGKGKND